MNPLDKLIGQIVNARIKIDEDDFKYVVGKVLSVDINDYYFYDKSEPIYITVLISPLEELDTNLDSETLATIPLECITKH